MDKNDFIKAMEEMLAVAKTNGNQISMEELLDYFSDVPMNEETRKLLFDTFEEAGVRVIGYEAEKKNETKEENTPKEKKESEAINSMVPLWKKNKKKIKEEDYNNFKRIYRPIYG